jgi:putative colanic acid biosynthesis acetyltransferase WcaF
MLKKLNKIKLPNDGGPTFTFWNRLYRTLWSIFWVLLCSWTPPYFRKWRIFILKLFGAKIGRQCDVRRTAKVWSPKNLIMKNKTMLADGVICYNVANITLNEGALVSQRAFLCSASHNLQEKNFLLIAKPIILDKNSWIASEAFVGPGVFAGEGSVLAARAAAFSDLEPWFVYRGNPAVKLRARNFF